MFVPLRLYKKTFEWSCKVHNTLFWWDTPDLGANKTNALRHLPLPPDDFPEIHNKADGVPAVFQKRAYVMVGTQVFGQPQFEFVIIVIPS
jgi:hypothetical protein